VKPTGRVLAASAVAAGLTPLNSTMIAVALPAMSAEFATPAASVTVWVVTAYLIATIVCQMPAGGVADRIGYARTLTVGRWMFAAGAAAATFAPSLAFVIAGRLCMALGGALMIPTAMALLRVAVPEERRPRAFGAMGAVMGGAAALGPALGGLLIARASWRVLFLVNVPLTLLSWLLQPKDFGPAPPPRRTGAFDWRGSVLLGTSLVLFVLATRLGAPLSWASAAGALALFVALVVQARRAPAPVVDFTLFREPAFVAGAAIIALQNLAMYALLVQVPFLFSEGAGESRLGLAIMGMTASMAVMSPVGGRLAERIGSRPTVVIGGLAGAVGIALIVQLDPAAPATEIGMRLLLVGLGLGLSTGPSQAAALSAIEPERSGMASAALSTLRYIGAVAGTAILGLALGAGGGDTLARQHAALWVFAGAFVLSALSGLGFRRTR
jgi:EmrB/QacA subfamily drug resistance transporter